MTDNDNPKIGITVEQFNLGEELIIREPNTEALAILPTRNVVLFPDVTITVNLKRELSLAIAEKACQSHTPIGILCQKDGEEENPNLWRGMHRTGVVADVLKVIEMPDGEKTAIIHGRMPFKVTGSGQRGSFPAGTMMAKAQLLEDVFPEHGDRSFSTIIKHIKKLVAKILPAYSDALMHMINSVIKDGDLVMTVNMLCTNLPFEPADKQRLLAERSVKERALELLKFLKLKEQELDLSLDILNKVRIQLDDEQRRAILQRQMEVIHDQLYGEDNSAEVFRAKAAELPLPVQAKETVDRELQKLEHLNPQSPDYFVVYNYIETVLDLPWGKADKINDDFDKARKSLDQDHSGLEKVKERILEQLAVLMHKPDGKAPILCLVGPPGVGKTSLGKSVADAMGRGYQRVALGGLHDEAEIRGHRRTYIGAMPGRIMDAIKKAKTNNPVLVLDEVDKLGADYKGDPSSALLEVLDPEQNNHFHDNYIDVDFDLSHVLFIATANTLSTIPKPLLDRMETINLSGYLAEEKLEIAKQHLIKRTRESLGLKENELKISDAALKAVIENYTNESGVRQLEKALSSIGRKKVLAEMSHTEFPDTVEPQDLKKLLGLAPFNREKYEDNSFAGVVTGLAWTEVGGEILLAEASLVPGKGSETVTGNLGNVMKESASIAYQWVRAHAKQIGIDPALFEKYNLHVHFPEGAVPKDGPSAGITIATAIVSAFTQRRVRERIAMTGEITLRGKVLPVGGIKEKILAAKRAGINTIVLSADNRKDIEDIDSRYIQGLDFHYVNTALDVMRFAITDQPVADPIEL
ncbi:MAG: endopeptidase La [Bacteroidales bacterium]|nr:endopeptidase La [Bacteroidales bacterium]